MHECILNSVESLNDNKITSGGDEKVISYFEANTYKINLLSTMCSINNQNNNEDGVINNDMNKDKIQRGNIPSLTFNNKD